MEPPDWNPVYLTDEERVVIATNLLDSAETVAARGHESQSKHLYFLAGLVTYAPGERLRS